MNKEKVLKGNKEIYLSAQDYSKLSNDDKKQLREVLKEENKDPDEYEEKMKKMWPKEVYHTLKSWRRR